MHVFVFVCSHHGQQFFCPKDVFLYRVSILLHLSDQQGQVAAGLFGPEGDADQTISVYVS